MKVCIQTSSNYSGGAARAANRLHHALLATGCESELNSGFMWMKGENVKGPESMWGRKTEALRARAERLLQRLQSTTNTNKHSAAFLSSRKAADINRSPYDVINLHWICNGYLSIEEIGRIRKPLVWTLHDMWPFSGGEHMSPLHETARWRNGYLNMNRDIEHRGLDIDRWAWNRKKKHWTTPFQIITPSRWLADCVKTSFLMKDWPVTVIPNPLDTETYRPFSQRDAREELGLPQDALIILFSTPYGIQTYSKGWDLLKEALHRLNADFTNLQCVVVGQQKPGGLPDPGFPVHWMGFIDDDDIIAKLYSAADVTIIPSRIDNLPQIGTEAQACGCPVVAFDVGGLSDIVEHERTGYLAKALDTSDLANGIKWVLNDQDRRKEMSRKARERAVNLWSSQKIAERYVELYQDVLEGRFS